MTTTCIKKPEGIHPMNVAHWKEINLYTHMHAVNKIEFDVSLQQNGVYVWWNHGPDT